nr:hypothetical protein [Tanacetum cinerariifolium]
MGTVEDKILVHKPPKNYARCTRCGYLVDGPNCQGCALLRQELEENLVAHSQDFQNSSDPSNASTNVVNAPREPYVAKQDNGSFVDKIIFRAPDSPDQFYCFHCKDVLRAGETCKRCTCAKCGSGRGKGLCYICRHNQNSLNDSPSISKTSSQSPSNINHCCSECGDPLNGIFYKRCTYVLRAGETCKRCTCAKCGSGLGKGLCYSCGHNQNSLNNSPSISEPSSQSPSNINHCCYECGDPLGGIFCKRCTCKSCGKDAHIGYNCPSKVLVISNPKPCNNQTIDGLPQALPIFHPTFHSKAESSFTVDPTPTYVDESPNVFNPPPTTFYSCVENLVLNPSESEGKNGCDMPPDCTTFSKVLCDAECESDSSDDQSPSDEDVLETIVSKPMCEEEIIPMKSLRTHASSLPLSSKINYLLDEFAGKLTLLKSIPPGIDETDCDFEEDIYLIEKFESFSPSPIPIKDSDSYMEEIDLSLNSDDPMPPGIEEDDDDSERDIPILDELLDNYSLSLPKKESFHFDIPLFSHPPAKPPDGNTGILNIKMMGDISDQKAFMHKLMITLASHQEKSPDLLSHR